LVDKISSISHQLYIIMHAPNKLYSVLSFNWQCISRYSRHCTCALPVIEYWSYY
jgi:hypothetical protein